MYAIVKEYDLGGALAARFKMAVPLAEAAFNRLNPVSRPDGSVFRPIGFQFYNTAIPGVDPCALYLMRSEFGDYLIDEIRVADDPDRPLIVARDMVESPFAGEKGQIYATGYNASAAPDSGFRGRAWVYRGTGRR